MTSCTGCKKGIRGEFVRALEGDWHPTCFTCEDCHRPFGSQRFFVHNGLPYHEDCHLRRFARNCGGCSKPITDRYLSALGRDWHPACLVCGGCRQPIGGKQFAHADQQAWHANCLVRAKAPRCSICAQPMTGRYQRDLFGNSYCENHGGDLVPCFSCRRLICDALTQGGRRNRDGHEICHICSGTAVTKTQEATFLLDRTRRDLNAIGLSFGHEKLPFRLVSQRQLDRFNTNKRSDQPTLGMARHQVVREGTAVVDRQFLEIIILRGLPREHFQTVAAHELCHAWLFYRGYGQLPERVEEGLSTLCEFLWLGRQKTHAANVRRYLLRKNPDPIYGEGLRLALRVMERRSLPALLAYVKKHKKFPGLLRRMFA